MRAHCFDWEEKERLTAAPALFDVHPKRSDPESESMDGGGGLYSIRNGQIKY